MRVDVGAELRGERIYAEPDGEAKGDVPVARREPAAEAQDVRVRLQRRARIHGRARRRLQERLLQLLVHR